jgi:outer membrane protein insertion porin family
VGGNLSTPLQVSQVRIEGTKVTRPGFLSRVVNPYLNSDTEYSESTLESVIHQTRNITYALARTELFRKIVPEIETPLDPLADASAVDIVLRCEERGRLSLKSATEVGNGDASAVRIIRLAARDYWLTIGLDRVRVPSSGMPLEEQRI